MSGGRMAGNTNPALYAYHISQARRSRIEYLQQTLKSVEVWPGPHTPPPDQQLSNFQRSPILPTVYAHRSSLSLPTRCAQHKNTALKSLFAVAHARSVPLSSFDCEAREFRFFSKGGITLNTAPHNVHMHRRRAHTAPHNTNNTVWVPVTLGVDAYNSR